MHPVIVYLDPPNYNIDQFFINVYIIKIANSVSYDSPQHYWDIPPKYVYSRTGDLVLATLPRVSYTVGCRKNALLI